MRPLKSITNRLAFRIISPAIIMLVLIGWSLYFFVLAQIKHFADETITGAMEKVAHAVYHLCERNYNDLRQSRSFADEHKTKAVTIRMIEEYLRDNTLRGTIYENKRRLLSADFPAALSESILDTSREHEVATVYFEGERYYAHYSTFSPWNWHFVILKSAAEYSSLTYRVTLAYVVAGFTLLFSTIILLFYLNSTIKQPVDKIITRIGKGDKPDYQGIYELEFLSNKLRDIMELRERETRMLNNIYHIAASRRGEDFFEEVVMAINRMFDLNALILKTKADGDPAEIIAMFYEGALTKGGTINLKNTPCEDVALKKHMVILDKDAYKAFPQAELLTRIKAESYIGIAIFDRGGDVVGAVNALGKKRQFTESDMKVFQTIGQIVATEFEVLEKEKVQKRMQEELYQSQKMEAVGTLAGGIAHDFNNMLQGILGYASLMKMNIAPSDQMYKALDVIEQSAEKASELTKQLLGFARKGKYIVEPINLNDIVKDVVTIISRTFDRSIEILTTLKDDIWTIEGDRSQVENVILNLCLNARDAMPGGGSLSIETANKVIEEENIPYPWLKPGNFSLLKIADTGIGMDEEVRKHIFEPFFTTKDHGTGMGLAMVYGVVKNHDGFILVESAVGKGTTFMVYLPAVKKDARRDVLRETALPHGKGTILVIDDEEFIRIFARETLERLGYEVLEASAGQEGLNIYAAAKDRIDLVLLDLNMPRMSGDMVFRELKKINPGVRAIISSGYEIEEKMGEIIKDPGIAGFIQKPYNIAEIADKISAALSR